MSKEMRFMSSVYCCQSLCAIGTDRLCVTLLYGKKVKGDGHQVLEPSAECPVADEWMVVLFQTGDNAVVTVVTQLYSTNTLQ